MSLKQALTVYIPRFGIFFQVSKSDSFFDASSDNIMKNSKQGDAFLNSNNIQIRMLSALIIMKTINQGRRLFWILIASKRQCLVKVEKALRPDHLVIQAIIVSSFGHDVELAQCRISPKISSAFILHQLGTIKQSLRVVRCSLVRDFGISPLWAFCIYLMLMSTLCTVRTSCQPLIGDFFKTNLSQLT